MVLLLTVVASEITNKTIYSNFQYLYITDVQEVIKNNENYIYDLILYNKYYIILIFEKMLCE